MAHKSRQPQFAVKNWAIGKNVGSNYDAGSNPALLPVKLIFSSDRVKKRI
jgi:hypothetical protein